MKDKNKTKDQLMKELAEMRLRIAELEKVEAECREAEEKMGQLYRQKELILNSVGEGIFGLDRLGKHTFVNPSAARMLGYEVEELIGQHSHTIWHHSKADSSPYPEEDCPIYAAYKDGAARHVRDEVFWKKDGTSFSAAYTSTPIMEKGNIAGAVVTFWDITERKRSTEMLAKALNEQKNIMDTIPDIIYILDMTGKLVKWNRSVEIVTGFSSEKLKGKHVLDFFPEQDRISIADAIKEAFEKRYAQTEGHLLRKDGTAVPYEWTGAPFKDEQDNVIGLIGIGRDISKRKEVQKTLEESEERFRQIAESSGEFIWEVDINGLYTYANPVVEEILGYSLDEIIGKKHFYDFFHPDDRDTLKKAAFEVFSKRKSFRNFINPNLHENGNMVIFETSGLPIMDKKGDLLGYRGSDRDITERKEAEDALRQSENKYRTLIENLPQKIFFKDKSSVYVSCNENYARDLKIKSDEIIGKTDFDFFPEELAKKYRTDDKRVMESRNTEDIEERYIQDGREIWVFTVKTPTRDEKGNSIGVLGIFWDITERKKTEEQIKKLNEELVLCKLNS